MYEYKVLSLRVKECEKVLNDYAREGWRVAAMVPNNSVGVGIVGFIVTLERQR